MIQHIFELLPVALAIIAAISCAKSFGNAKTRPLRCALGLGVVCSVLLVVAQSSWWGSFMLQHSLEGTTFANGVWTVFNSLTMVAFIVLSRYARQH